MRLIAFDQSQLLPVIKAAGKYIQMQRNEEGHMTFKDMTCRHRGGPLTHGTENTGSVICPWHGKKTRKCRIHYLDVAFVENSSTVWVGLQDIERLIYAI
ncbi:Rieske 2Fe-2S domain-containing protein [Pseudomonas cyclaminis]|uniref:Rieske 2Fe-2S domain-containing protein n=1 Tax=Pseudomonas cyclaminis TaxID=2781239 RepID=UPI0037F9E6EE